ncbi:thyrostimulin alpha-2 subunit-like [Centruroides sculpturatus]|uniref:thyrostimulin alpha-2 subunit-like n=1 Tax=Centruroides sculpturatus TaxID=218467 RepID=UPI000C6D0A48|nr:thyrostimulin alpha-2 subunit-like [Centruroides sculpturatus]
MISISKTYFWIFYSCFLCIQVQAYFWERSGCHKVGHTRRVSIPDCVEFDITTNACRGFCVSFSIPSSEETLRINPHQAITSMGYCCNIMETEDVSDYYPYSVNFYFRFD